MIVGQGRPLRFLGAVGGGWVTLRIAMVWVATGSLPEAVREVVPIPKAALAAEATTASLVVDKQLSARPPHRVRRSVRASVPTAVAAEPRRRAVDPVRVQLALLAMTRVAGSLPAMSDSVGGGPGTTSPARMITAPAASTMSPQRISVSSWMIARDGGVGGGAAALSPQLGGTQGGVRVDYALGRGLAATTRIAAPAAGAGREVSLGVAWRPSGVPLRLVAEQRIALDRGRSGPALGVSGGVSELRLPAGFRVDGYGQAGAILRDGVERYVDGSVRAARPIAAVGGAAIDIGGGVWGGAQRGVARVDIGPSIGAQVPIADRRLRLSLDWRQRVAGNARPGSGLALTLGSDF